jgi:hypothetical protein
MERSIPTQSAVLRLIYNYSWMRQKMMKKKGEALSMNVIVVAVIALIILIVLIVVFSSRMGIFNKGVNSCKDKGGVEKPSNVDCITAGGTPIGPYFEENTGIKRDTVCCAIKE